MNGAGADRGVVTLGNWDQTIGFVISLALVIVYHGALGVAEAYKDVYRFKPYLLIWIPNAILIALGLFLIWRLDKR